jgi:hypothetical protein
MVGAFDDILHARGLSNYLNVLIRHSLILYSKFRGDFHIFPTFVLFDLLLDKFASFGLSYTFDGS